MREIPMTAVMREEVGKGFARRARMAGQIPGVIYGPETEPMAVAVVEHEFRTAMKTADSSSILNIHVDGKEHKAVVRDVQRDEITNKVIHVDFHAISMSRPINVALPITFIGEPVGVKVDGGIMNATIRELEISCLPKDIPDSFEIDVSELNIGDSLHVRDLDIPNVDILTSERRTVVVISAPTVIKSEVTEGEEEGEEGLEEGAEGEAAAAEGEEAPAADEKKKPE